MGIWRGSRANILTCAEGLLGKYSTVRNGHPHLTPATCYNYSPLWREAVIFNVTAGAEMASCACPTPDLDHRTRTFRCTHPRHDCLSRIPDFCVRGSEGGWSRNDRSRGMQLNNPRWTGLYPLPRPRDCVAFIPVTRPGALAFTWLIRLRTQTRIRSGDRSIQLVVTRCFA